MGAAPRLTPLQRQRKEVTGSRRHAPTGLLRQEVEQYQEVSELNLPRYEDTQRERDLLGVLWLGC